MGGEGKKKPWTPNWLALALSPCRAWGCWGLLLFLAAERDGDTAACLVLPRCQLPPEGGVSGFSIDENCGTGGRRSQPSPCFGFSRGPLLGSSTPKDDSSPTLWLCLHAISGVISTLACPWDCEDSSVIRVVLVFTADLRATAPESPSAFFCLPGWEKLIGSLLTSKPRTHAASAPPPRRRASRSGRK